ncbi:MAG: NADH-quinone oxidoreductase subunit K [Coriobacteriia bacterium]|nr:NADH-quinone oxidoreductase subunit K [Coriobacteriia bacterium]
MLLTLFILAIVLTAATGIYCLLVTQNMIRVLISMELINKGGALLLAVAGLVNGQTALAESFIIALIFVEVVVTAIGAVLCIAMHARTGSLDISNLSLGKEADHVE